MVLVAAPNPYSALTVRLASFAEISALVSSAPGWQNGGSGARISSVRQADWKLPAHAILIRKAGGPRADGDRDARSRRSRADLWYYGPGKDPGTQEREAYRLYLQTVPAFRPDTGESFVAANCRVYTIEEEAEPFPYVDQDTGWRVLVGPVVITWSEIPAL
jgi:hypothetical protein